MPKLTGTRRGGYMFLTRHNESGWHSYGPEDRVNNGIDIDAPTVF